MTKQIPLTKGYFTTVDDEDYDFLMQWKWAYKSGYAARNAAAEHGPKQLHYGTTYKRRIVLMHRLITGATEHHVDHHDGDRLNNTRANLRLCNQSQNLGNQGKRSMLTSSRYKGVSWGKKDKKWVVKVGSTYVGVFTSEEDAGHAYDAAARKRFGEFARLNFPDGLKGK